MRPRRARLRAAGGRCARMRQCSEEMRTDERKPIMKRNIARREFVRAGSILAAGAAFGGVGACLEGCAKEDSVTSGAASAALAVKVEDGAFYVNGSKKGIPYSGDALHLSPNPKAGKLCVEYHDGEGALGVFVKEWE